MPLNGQVLSGKWNKDSVPTETLVDLRELNPEVIFLNLVIQLRQYCVLEFAPPVKR